MARRYKLTYKIMEIEEQVKAFCDNENLNPYIRKNHKASYTPWSSQDGKFDGYVAWYVTK